MVVFAIWLICKLMYPNFVLCMEHEAYHLKYHIYSTSSWQVISCFVVFPQRWRPLAELRYILSTVKDLRIRTCIVELDEIFIFHSFWHLSFCVDFTLNVQVLSVKTCQIAESSFYKTNLWHATTYTWVFEVLGNHFMLKYIISVRRSSNYFSLHKNAGSTK